MPVDRAVDEVAQRPDRLVEHRGRADPQVIAHKAQVEVEQLAQLRAHERVPGKRRAVDDRAVDDRRDGGGDGRALHAQRGEPEQAEDEHGVERDIGDDGAGRAGERNDDTLGALQQCAAGLGERLEGIAQRDNAQIGRGDAPGLPVAGEQADDGFGREHAGKKKDEGRGEHEEGHEAVGAVDTAFIVRAIELGDEDSGAAGEAEQRDVEEPRPLAGHADGGQRRIAEAADHEGIDQGERGEEQVLQRDGDGDGEHRAPEAAGFPCHTVLPGCLIPSARRESGRPDSAP